MRDLAPMNAFIIYTLSALIYTLCGLFISQCGGAKVLQFVTTKKRVSQICALSKITSQFGSLLELLIKPYLI
jgi:hypothetical protein